MSARSVFNLVRRKFCQAFGIGSPIGSRIRGNGPVVVEIYALGRGVTLVGQGSDLLCREGSFELEANGKVFVVDPLVAIKTQGFVFPVERDVSTVLQPVKTVDQSEFAKSGHLFTPLKTAILALPQGMGKTLLAPDFASRIGCSSIVDEWNWDMDLTNGALHLTSDISGLPS